MLLTTCILETGGVSFTTFQFSRVAIRLWEAYERHKPVGALQLTWQEFSILFLEKFVPQSCRKELHKQFEQLREDGMSMTQYEMKFSELARHAVSLVPTDRERINRFIDGLTYQLQFLMTREIVFGATFDDVVDIAWHIEVVYSQECGEREAKRPRGSDGSGGVPSGGQSYHSRGRPYRHTQTGCPVHGGALSNHGSYRSHQELSSLSALPVQSMPHAPLVQGLSVPGSSGSYSGSRGPPQNFPQFFEMVCYECGEMGHAR
ncbi:uncharacterized protein [Nicotiana tomentosiformis]|uniref:uncharacterized protein n=1 Tax=Nicotiana tomentosiformis TaxID=4098 RepID=UPI00388C717C